jgi:hypothetical protein
MLRRLAGQHDLVAALRVVADELQPDRARPADDDDGSPVRHRCFLRDQGLVGLPGHASTPRSANAFQVGCQR